MKSIKKLWFEIDAAMLGKRWIGGLSQLIALAEIYEQELKKEFPEYRIEVIFIVNSYNGATQNELQDNSAWSRAIDRTPSTWWRE